MSWRRYEMIGTIALVAVAWVAIIIGLSHLQQNSVKGNPRLPALPHYPGTENVREQVVPNTTDLHRYWFQFDEEYPSLTVYHWYNDTLAAQGRWRPVGTAEPVWVHRQEKDRLADMLTASWLSADGLFEIDLQLVSITPIKKQVGGTATGTREPGMKVYVSLRRNLMPWVNPPTRER